MHHAANVKLLHFSLAESQGRHRTCMTYAGAWTSPPILRYSQVRDASERREDAGLRARRYSSESLSMRSSLVTPGRP